MKNVLLTVAMVFGIANLSIAQDAPDEAVFNFLNQIKANNPAVAWDGIPATYQKRITGLVTDFATKADPEIYDRYHAMIGKAGKVMAQQKVLILDTMSDYMPVVPAEAGVGIDTLAEIMQIIATAPGAKLKNLENPDIGAMMKDTGGKIMRLVRAVDIEGPDGKTIEDHFAGIDDVFVNVLENEDGVAKVEIGHPDLGKETLTMKVIEGKWVNARDYKHMDKKLDRVERMIDRWDADSDQAVSMRKHITEAMDMMDEMLDDVAAAETGEEIMMQLMRHGMKMGSCGKKFKSDLAL